MLDLNNLNPRLVVYTGETEDQVKYGGGNSPAANGMALGGLQWAETIIVENWSSKVIIGGVAYNTLCFSEQLNRLETNEPNQI
jgi:alpha-D-ribose 1-methylphosphonate 5-phosphate C-P lyase